MSIPGPSSPESESESEALDPEGAPAIPAGALVALARTASDSVRLAARAAGLRAPTGVAEIWRLSWPVMLSQVLVNMVSIVDIAMVGRLGTDAVAAVGYATQSFFLAQSALIAVGFACVALVARLVATGDREGPRRAVAASLQVGVVTALLLTLPIMAAPRAWLGLLSAEPAVVVRTIPYLRLLLASAPLLALSMVWDAALRADRDTTTPMRIAAVVTLVKIGLNLVLIFGLLGAPRLELVGAGLATIVAQLVGVGCYLTVAFRRRDSVIAIGRSDLRAGRALIKDVRRIALPGVLERVLLNMALLSYFSILGRYGTVAVAAYTVGVRILSFSWIPGIGYAAAVATLVGQALGRDEPTRATEIGWCGARMALITAVVLGIVCALARFRLAALFLDDAATIATLGPFMLCVALAQPMLQTHFTLGGAHRGAGDTWTPLVAATVGNWVFRVPLAVLFGVLWHTDLIWIWTALIVDHSARAAWLTWAFRKGGWKSSLAKR